VCIQLDLKKKERRKEDLNNQLSDREWVKEQVAIGTQLCLNGSTTDFRDGPHLCPFAAYFPLFSPHHGREGSSKCGGNESVHGVSQFCILTRDMFVVVGGLRSWRQRE
jgi:hypothetical protein